MAPPAGHVRELFFYNRNQQELLKLTVTYFRFCSGAAKEGGSHGSMVPAELYFDLQERFDTVNFSPV